jgi:3-hydroxyisobutyrate dehydrogenase-like beta-hydroxyacid dehydrogenase
VVISTSRPGSTTCFACDVIITCLLGPAADSEVYRGPNGLLEFAKGKLFINTATVGPEAARTLAADVESAGGEYVDAPLMGGGAPAALEGSLLLPVGCAPTTFERAVPVLRLLADRIEHLGPAGTAQIMKLVNNLQVAIHHAALSEALRMGLAAGLDREAMLRTFPQGLSRSRSMERNLKPMLEGIRTNRGTLKTSSKDLDLALELARSVGEPSEVGAAASRRVPPPCRARFRTSRHSGARRPRASAAELSNLPAITATVRPHHPLRRHRFDQRGPEPGTPRSSRLGSRPSVERRERGR